MASAVAFVAAVGACDTTLPSMPGDLVVEGYVSSGNRSLVKLSRSGEFGVGADESRDAVVDAIVQIEAPGRSAELVHVGGGRYRTVESFSLAAGDSFGIFIKWQTVSTSAFGRIPPEAEIADIVVTHDNSPVEAALLDSLRLDVGGTGAVTGFIYPVRVEIMWQETQLTQDDWIQTRLEPFSDFGSALIDFFLVDDGVFQETLAPVVNGRRSWSGLYAVPVASGSSPFPSHTLKVSMVRSNRDYARFVVTSETPERREPSSNLHGAIGIVVGISFDDIEIIVD